MGIKEYLADRKVREMYAEEYSQCTPGGKRAFDESISSGELLFDFRIGNMLEYPTFNMLGQCSENFIRDLFENKVLFEKIDSLIKEYNKTPKDQRGTPDIRILQFENYSRPSSLYITLSQLLGMAKNIYLEKASDVPKAVMKRIKKLERIFSAEKLKDSKEIYSVMANGEIFSVPVSELVSLLTMDEQSFNDEMKKNDEAYNEKLIYAIYEFTNPSRKKNGICVLDSYCFPEESYARLKKIDAMEIADFETFLYQKLYRNPLSDKYTIHDDLKKEVYNDMPSELTDSEKAIYIYGRLCQILTYSEEYKLYGNNSKNMNEILDISTLSSITPDNNEVVCYQFAYIYAKFLEANNIPHQIVSNAIIGGDVNRGGLNFLATDKYSDKHTYIFFEADEMIITADSTTTILGGDLINTKINGDIEGMSIKTKVPSKEKKFNDSLKKIQTFLQQYQANLPTQEFVKLYAELAGLEVVDNPTFEDWQERIAQIKEIPGLTALDRAAFTLRISEMYFPNELLDLSIFASGEIEAPHIMLIISFER